MLYAYIGFDGCQVTEIIALHLQSAIVVTLENIYIAGLLKEDYWMFNRYPVKGNYFLFLCYISLDL